VIRAGIEGKVTSSPWSDRQAAIRNKKKEIHSLVWLNSSCECHRLCGPMIPRNCQTMKLKRMAGQEVRFVGVDHRADEGNTAKQDGNTAQQHLFLRAETPVSVNSTSVVAECIVCSLRGSIGDVPESPGMTFEGQSLDKALLSSDRPAEILTIMPEVQLRFPSSDLRERN
jgi:hypothetical protein